MSFTNPELQTRISALKGQFEEIDCSDAHSSGEDSQEVLLARYATIRLAVISNLLKTMENSLDQISICFEVSRAMFFYQNEIVRNAEFWAEERDVNQMLCSNNFKMAMTDMQSAAERLEAEVGLLQAGQGANQTAVHATLEIVQKYHELVVRFHEATGFLTEMEGRQEKDMPLYDADQCPNIGENSPEIHLKSLHLKSSRNADTAIALNVELAESFLESVRLTKLIIGSTSQGTSQELALLLNRFEALEDTRDNRYGFTQVRFE